MVWGVQHSSCWEFGVRLLQVLSASVTPRLRRPGTQGLGIASLTSQVPFLQAAAVLAKSLCCLAAIGLHHSSRE